MFALLMVLAVTSQFIAVRFGTTAAIIEMVLGTVVANIMEVKVTSFEWLLFLTSLAGVFMTFLAGSEVDKTSLIKNLKGSILIGGASFLAPFLGVFMVTKDVLGWDINASLLAAVALSETSIAIVYVVLVEGGKSGTPLGSMLLSACFFTNLFSSIALTLLFSEPSLGLAILASVLIAIWLFSSKGMIKVSKIFKERSSDAVIKTVIMLLAIMMAISVFAGVAAVLGAYVTGVAMANFMRHQYDDARKMKVLTTSFLSSFFFISAGMSVDASVLLSAMFVILFLMGVRLAVKTLAVGVVMRITRSESVLYSALLMSTSLTFGMVFCQFGLANGIIGQSEFSVLVMVLILCAIVPTIIAQRYYNPWR